MNYDGWKWTLYYQNTFGQYDAEAVCVQAGGNLVALRDSAASTQMASWFTNKNIPWAWIGLRSLTGQQTIIKSQWGWIATGQTPVYDNWNNIRANEPNNYAGTEGEARAMYFTPVTHTHASSPHLHSKCPTTSLLTAPPSRWILTAAAAYCVTRAWRVQQK